MWLQSRASEELWAVGAGVIGRAIDGRARVTVDVGCGVTVVPYSDVGEGGGTGVGEVDVSAIEIDEPSGVETADDRFRGAANERHRTAGQLVTSRATLAHNDRVTYVDRASAGAAQCRNR